LGGWTQPASQYRRRGVIYSMDFAFNAEDEKFRKEVKEFIRAEPPDKFPIQKEDGCYGFGAWSYDYQRKLGEKGWVGFTWPKKYGGYEGSVRHQMILWEELAYARAPIESVFYAEAVGGIIVKTGTEELKQKLIPDTTKGRIAFCECLSEPNFGSDLFSLQTRAIHKGNEFILDGQKVWISNAHLANFGIVIARTNPEVAGAHGIGALIVDLSSPGVTVNPLITIAGEKDFNEVFFDHVVVPEINFLGQKEKGYRAALECVEWDRFWGRACKGSFYQRLLEQFIDSVRESGVLEDPVVQNKLAGLATDIELCKLFFWRIVSMQEKGLTVNYEHCLAKTFADEMSQRFFHVTTDIIGQCGLLGKGENLAPMAGFLPHGFLNTIGQTLAGGTSEINRNTIATRGLGLPR